MGNTARNTAAWADRIGRGKLLLIPALLFALFTFAPAASGIEIEKEAEMFYEALKSGERLPLFKVDEAERTEENAYKIQAALFKKILEDTDDAVAGYKGADDLRHADTLHKNRESLCR